jgi:hypothetical protein
MKSRAMPGQVVLGTLAHRADVVAMRSMRTAFTWRRASLQFQADHRRRRAATNVQWRAPSGPVAFRIGGRLTDQGDCRFKTAAFPRCDGAWLAARRIWRTPTNWAGVPPLTAQHAGCLRFDSLALARGGVLR